MSKGTSGDRPAGLSERLPKAAQTELGRLEGKVRFHVGRLLSRAAHIVDRELRP